MTTITLPIFDIVITLGESDPDNAGAFLGGSIKTNLHDGPKTIDGGEYEDAIDGMESLILSAACAGVDVSTPQFVEAIQTTVDNLANKYL